MRWLGAGLLALLVLGVALVSPATYYYHIYEALQTTTGEAISGASYYIYVAGTTTETTIYSDRAGTALTQPQTTASDGMIDCYALAGTYDIAYTHDGWNLTGTLENFTYGVADTLGSQVSVDVDTLHADTLYVRMKTPSGKDEAGFDVQLIYPDTIKARLGTALYVRADDGQDDAVLYVYELQACLVYADTAKAGLDTTLYIRSDDGQDDTLLDVAYISGVTAATVETVYVTGQIQGGTRDYIWLDNVCHENIAENTVTCVYNTYDSNGHNVGVTGIRTAESWGVPFIRDGSITGIACQYGVQAAPLDATDSVFVRIFVDGDSLFYAAAQVDTSGIHAAFPVFYKTQAPGVATFSAGEKLNALWGSIGTGDADSKYKDPYLRIEVQYDD